jgi:hypothetical protein
MFQLSYAHERKTKTMKPYKDTAGEKYVDIIEAGEKQRAASVAKINEQLAMSGVGCGDCSAFSIADNIETIADQAGKAIIGLNIGHAHLCGRIRFYISVLRGEWEALPVEQLADVMEEDLKRIEEMHATYFKPNTGSHLRRSRGIV